MFRVKVSSMDVGTGPYVCSKWNAALEQHEKSASSTGSSAGARSSGRRVEIDASGSRQRRRCAERDPEDEVQGQGLRHSSRNIVVLFKQHRDQRRSQHLRVRTMTASSNESTDQALCKHARRIRRVPVECWSAGPEKPRYGVLRRRGGGGRLAAARRPAARGLAIPGAALGRGRGPGAPG